MDDLPPEHVNRLGVRFYFDNNFVTDDSLAAAALRRYHDEGWIDLWRTDTLDTELADAKDSERLMNESSRYVESLGPAVWGHSRWGHSVFASEEDAKRIDHVFAILFPGSDRHDLSTGRARRKLRDAMHVATAIRYGANGFITRDKRDLVRKSDAIAGAFNGFRIMTPERALAFVERMKARYEARMGSQ